MNGREVLSVADVDVAGDRRRAMGAIFLLSLILIAAGCAARGARSWKRGLEVRTIQVRGNRIVPSADLVKLAAVHPGDRLFDVDIAAVQKRVLASPFVRSAVATRDTPDRITITVAERVPVAAVAADKMYLLDAEGYVMPAARTERTFDLPVLTGSIPAGQCVPGARIRDESVGESLALLSAAQLLSEELSRRISEVHIDQDKGILLYMADSGVPVVYGHGDAPDKLVKLDEFWREFVSRRGTNELQYVDLRFDGQVVVRWHQSAESGVQ